MKTVLIVTIPVLSLFAAGAWNQYDAQATRTDAQTDVPFVTNTPALPQPATPAMWTTTQTVYRGETLELHFSGANAPFLGVVDPTGHFFYVVFPREAAVGKLQPLVDSEAFAGLSELPIPTATFTADPYTYGQYCNQRVFTQSGTYTFITGENLHVDDPAFVEKVTVKYIHEARPAIAMR
ncbi:MAG: hypothetical protein EP344_12295 [Bacteroidetes bacterium]|nr:MAG: hypothetical protein EP344_12295 [Bacteroidota bacterium]